MGSYEDRRSMIEYKTWQGKFPQVILLKGDILWDILYYETGFEQLHPFPSIVEWVEKQGYKYQYDWKVVRVEEDRSKESEWALCFPNKEICELFVLKFL